MISSEIAELMAVKAKHSAGGEYSPDWRPKVITQIPPLTTLYPTLTQTTSFYQYLPEELMPPSEAPPPPPMPLDEPPVLEPARPAWRSVVKRPEPGARRKGKAAAAAAAPTPPPPPPPAIEAPRPELPSWAQWRRKHASILILPGPRC
jgi:hypothetical protein